MVELFIFDLDFVRIIDKYNVVFNNLRQNEFASKGFILFIGIVVIILSVRSSVNFEAKKTYKLLNCLIIFDARSSNIQFYRFKIKV